MQPGRPDLDNIVKGFQSSPDSKVGCNYLIALYSSFVKSVSILTRLEGRVQLLSDASSFRACRFQSSPDSKVGCNYEPSHGVVFARAFQSSPDSKVGCNTAQDRRALPPPMFQSSPDSKVGCNPRNLFRRPARSKVSILTRLEGRVQRVSAFQYVVDIGFNPHPTRRSGATGFPLTQKMAHVFQSSPDSKVGCNVNHRSAGIAPGKFQSSPDSKVGCNGDR